MVVGEEGRTNAPMSFIRIELHHCSEGHEKEENKVSLVFRAVRERGGRSRTKRVAHNLERRDVNSDRATSFQARLGIRFEKVGSGRSLRPRRRGEEQENRSAALRRVSPSGHRFSCTLVGGEASKKKLRNSRVNDGSLVNKKKIERVRSSRPKETWEDRSGD